MKKFVKEERERWIHVILSLITILVASFAIYKVFRVALYIYQESSEIPQLDIERLLIIGGTIVLLGVFCLILIRIIWRNLVLFGYYLTNGKNSFVLFVCRSVFPNEVEERDRERFFGDKSDRK